MGSLTTERNKFLNNGKREEMERIKVTRRKFMIIRARWSVKRYIREHDTTVNSHSVMLLHAYTTDLSDLKCIDREIQYLSEIPKKRRDQKKAGYEIKYLEDEGLIQINSELLSNHLGELARKLQMNGRIRTNESKRQPKNFSKHKYSHGILTFLGTKCFTTSEAIIR